MSYSTLRYEVADGILVLTLNRPERMNAFTTQMADELVHAFERVNDDESVRAVIVTGAGKTYCVGMDLSVSGNVFGLEESAAPTLEDMHERIDDPAVVHGIRDTGGRVTLAIFNCTKPVIAAVNGTAVGIGATMTLAMDIRLASDQARFGFVFGKIGIVPEACSSWFLPRVVGLSQALEWVYTADIFDAEEARRGGLVKTVVPADQLLDEAKRLARRIIDNRSSVAIALTRQMLYRNAAQAHPLEAHRIDSLAVFYTSQLDGKEGVQSFREKRMPKFVSRLPQDLPPFYDEWTRDPR